MANIAPAQVIVNPSYIEPGILLPYSQASGAFDTLAEGQPLTRLSDGDLYVYIKRIDMRSEVAAGQSAYNIRTSANGIGVESGPASQRSNTPPTSPAARCRPWLCCNWVSMRSMR